MEDAGVQNTGAGRILVQNIENVKGGTQGDTLYGSSQSNKLYGNDGDDILDGRAGVDSLYGGANNDTLKGGAGDDFIDGGDDNDTVDYSDTNNAVNLTLADGVDADATASIAGGEVDTIRNVENIIGSQSSDILTGNNTVNTLTGGGGNDTFKASDGEDTIIGNTGGKDTLDYSSRGTLNGTDGIEVTLNGESESTLKENGGAKDHLYSIENVIGTKADDTITGDSFSNTLKGQEGADTLSGGDGSDYLVGGDGIDTVDYSYVSSGNTEGVNVDLDNNKGVNLNNSEVDILEGIENVIGTSHDDTIFGNSLDNVLDGKAGDDTLRGGAGDDTFKGGDGVDTVDYRDVGVKLNIDLGSLAPTEVAAGQGTDTFEEIEGVIGGTNDDILKGTNGANNLRGYLGDDTLIGFGVSDTTNGSVDSLDGGEGNDTVSFGYSLNDINLSLSVGNSEQNTADGKVVVTNVENIEGGFGDDTLTGNNFVNTLSGGFGDDTLIGQGKNDTLDGGKDSNSHRFTGVGSFALTMVGVVITVTGASAQDIVDDFNTKNAARIIAGDESLGTITTNGSEIYLQTKATVDTVTGFTEHKNDYTFIDTVDYSGLATESIAVDLTQASEQVSVTGGTEDSKDTLIDIEKIIGTNQDDQFIGDATANTFLAGDGDDIINGGAGSDYIDGGAGDDIINGGDDDDVLNGGTGNDTFISTVGDGIDTIDGGSGNDTVKYETLSGNVSVTLDKNNQVRVKIDGVDNDYIKDIENIESGSGADTLTGDSENNTLKSNNGDDTLSGGAGDDYLDGGNHTQTDDSQGSTTVKTGAGDTADYSYLDTAGENKGVYVDLGQGTAGDRDGGTLVGTDTLENLENVVGSNFDDSLVGDGLNNTLNGSEGNDTLKGGAGDDELIGGDGTDTADFSDATDSVTVDLSVASGTSVDIGAGLGSDTFNSIEGAIGGNYDDTLKGTASENTLIGNDGDDTLLGNGAGSGEIDYLDGGANGVKGDYVSFDYLSKASTENGIKVDLSNTNEQDTDGNLVADLQIIDIENVQGSTSKDTITGNSSNNKLEGLAGDDTFYGSEGTDSIDGGTEDTADVVDYKNLASGVELTVNSDDSVTVQKNATHNDTLNDIEIVKATDNVDTLTGNDNNNTLYAGGGADTLIGNAGDDVLYGESW